MKKCFSNYIDNLGPSISLMLVLLLSKSRVPELAAVEEAFSNCKKTNSIQEEQ
jgi:hypothetical protein